MSNQEATKPARRKRKSVVNAMSSAARMAAVQALYQIDLTQAAPEAVLNEFVKHRLGQVEDMETAIAADADLFAAIVRGASARRGELDDMLKGSLGAHFDLERMETVLRAILRAGAFELMAHGEIDAPIIINDYVDVTHGFFAGKEPGIVNAVLDRLGRVLRAGDGAR